MRTLESWFSEYEESHRHPVNQRIHKVCVPAIFFSILLLHRVIPRMPWMEMAPEWLLNWATIAMIGPMVFYVRFGWSWALMILLQTVMMLSLAEFWVGRGLGLQLGVGIFGLAWTGQFYGHRIEGRKPSFLKDLVFLLIGPLWVLRTLHPPSKA